MIHNANTLVIANTVKAQGMVTIKSVKTGASRVQLTSKKDFTKAWVGNPANVDKPKKQAARDFEAYRQATLKDFNAQLATAIASGTIVAERLNADKTGDLRNISLVRRSTREQDQNKAALTRAAELMGVPVEQLIKQAKAHAPEAITEVLTTEVVEPAANAEQTAPASAGQPVETSA